MVLYADDAVIFAEDEKSMRLNWVFLQKGAVTGQWKLLLISVGLCI